MTSHPDQVQDESITGNQIYEIYKVLQETQARIDATITQDFTADEEDEPVATQLYGEDADSKASPSDAQILNEGPEAVATQTDGEDDEVNDSPIGTQIPDQSCMPNAPKKQKKQ
jgi:hypothetical protein